MSTEIVRKFRVGDKVRVKPDASPTLGIRGPEKHLGQEGVVCGFGVLGVVPRVLIGGTAWSWRPDELELIEAVSI